MHISSDFNLEANYGYRFLHANIAALYGDLNRGVFDFGGGLDYTLFRFLGLRAEVRDLVSGNPNLNVALSSSTQHNLISSGGIIIRF